MSHSCETVCLWLCVPGIYLGMTVPVLTLVRTEEANSHLSRAVTVAYYLPSTHQAQPPQPRDPDVMIETWPDTTVYTRSASGRRMDNASHYVI